MGQRVNNFLYKSFDKRLYLALDKIELCGQAFMVNSSGKQLKDIMKKCRSIGNPHCGACRENMALQNRPLDMGQLWGLLRKRLTEKINRKFADIIAADPWD